MQVLVYSAIAGAFGGFFLGLHSWSHRCGRLVLIKELKFVWYILIPGLIAGAVGYGVYFAILHTSFLGVLSASLILLSLRLVDLLSGLCWWGLFRH